MKTKEQLEEEIAKLREQIFQDKEYYFQEIRRMRARIKAEMSVKSVKVDRGDYFEELYIIRSFHVPDGQIIFVSLPALFSN